MLWIRVKEHERALRFKHGKLTAVHGPGLHWNWDWLWNPRGTKIKVVDTLQSRLAEDSVESVTRHAAAAEHLHVLVLSEAQRALVWRDGRLLHALGPGRYAFWKRPAQVEIETFDVSPRRVDHPKLDAIVNHAEARAWLEVFQSSDTDATLLYHNGVCVERLSPGRHVFWKGAGVLATRTIDLREQTVEVPGQEILTSDKVTLRVTLLVSFRVADPLRLLAAVSEFPSTLYREAQLALRAAVGTRTLDQLLADKDAVGAETATAVIARGEAMGVVVRAVGVRDIILPGEMKTILNQVIEAEKKAQAEGIRRREETASARSQANTAKLLAENPVMMRLRELEMIQEMMKGSNVTFVLGHADLADQLRALAGSTQKPS